MKRKTHVETVGGMIEHPKLINYRQVDGKKFKILGTDAKLAGGYIGLNKPASKEATLRGRTIKTNIRNNEIIISGNQSKKTRITTLHHELIETFLMSKGLNYKEAHQVALRFESTKTTPQGAFKWYLNNKK
jgi:hypothetical protein